MLKKMIFFLWIPLLAIGCGKTDNSYERVQLIEVKVKEVMVDPVSMSPVVVLQDAIDERTLPVWIGTNEAFAIITQLNGVNLPRPMTHDLLKNILTETHVSVTRVIITDLKDETYYAVILLEYQGKELTIDSRPSDAIALAMRVGAPIFISSKLLQTMGV